MLRREINDQSQTSSEKHTDDAHELLLYPSGRRAIAVPNGIGTRSFTPQKAFQHKLRLYSKFSACI
jgi:hypothetical protein